MKCLWEHEMFMEHEGTHVYVTSNVRGILQSQRYRQFVYSGM